MAILKDKSKKKKGENIIGKIIYGFLLFAPILSILTTSLYVVFNKNAYQSYYGAEINQSQNIYINSRQFINNKTYYAQAYTNFSSPDSYTNITIKATNIRNETTNRDYSSTDYDKIRFFKSSNNSIYTQILRIDEGTSTTITANDVIKFDYISTLNNGTIADYVNFWTIEYNKYSYLDNAFDYGMFKTEQNSVFNWAKNTGTYQVMTATTTGLGITNNFVPMLMAYWLLISIVYFIFDIALILIWAVHDKIHELKDAI